MVEGGGGTSRISFIITIFTKMVGFCQENELCETIYMYIDNCHTRGTIKNKYKFVWNTFGLSYKWLEQNRNRKTVRNNCLTKS